MAELYNWVVAHPIQAFLAYMLFMAAVQALPRPTDKSSAFYTWFYQFLHLASMNIQLVFQPRKNTPPAELEENRKAAEMASRQN